MRTILFITTIMTGIAWLSPAVADSSIASDTKAGKSDQVMKMPMYQPPRRGAPTMTVGGGTRGVTGKIPTVYVMAPDHVGLTTREQPSLNWYISDPGNKRFEFMLIDEEGIDPLLELKLDSSKFTRGIQTINLSDHNVKLKPGVKYTWSIIMISDEQHRSNDIITSGMIERQAPGSAAQNRLSKAGAKEDVYIFAEEGYWYDAINTLSGLIDKNPGDESLKQQRVELLKQVGLVADANK